MISNEHLVWGSAALVGLASTLLSRVRFFLSRALSMVFVTVELNGEAASGPAVLLYFGRDFGPFCWNRFQTKIKTR